MKKLSVIFFGVIILLVFVGCAKSEDAYKSEIYQHLVTHEPTIISYAYAPREAVLQITPIENLEIKDDKSATAVVHMVLSVGGEKIMECDVDISLDKDCNITECPYCNIGW